MQSIFTFNPIYKERPWGGKAIAEVGKRSDFPLEKKIGESWEISDRDGDESVISEGEFKGKTLRWLLDRHGTRIMGKEWVRGERFPLLVKILDARERLSLQVHPPASLAAKLQGEPKTEAWYLLRTTPEAALLAGLKKGADKKSFEEGIRNQNLESLVHRVSVHEGDLMFVPSGRVHAIDAGCLILEVQQNSDTTYRVYDWGRVGLDGKPRTLHIDESLQSIDFNDFEPSLISKKVDLWLQNEFFKMRGWSIEAGQMKKISEQTALILFVQKGSIEIHDDFEKRVIAEGTTVLLSAGEAYRLTSSQGDAEIILINCLL